MFAAKLGRTVFGNSNILHPTILALEFMRSFALSVVCKILMLSIDSGRESVCNTVPISVFVFIDDTVCRFRKRDKAKRVARQVSGRLRARNYRERSRERRADGAARRCVCANLSTKQTEDGQTQLRGKRRNVFASSRQHFPILLPRCNRKTYTTFQYNSKSN